MVVASGLLVGPVEAEHPSWEAMEERLYMFRGHQVNGPVDQCPSGIWNYNLDERAFSWLRTFTYNADDWNSSPPEPAGEGGGGRLSTAGDRLFFQGWPGIHELRVPTLQLIRRMPTEPLGTSSGWGVQGLVLSREPGGGFGLGPGILGFAWCTKRPTGPTWCDPEQLPGYENATVEGDSRVLLFQSFDDWTLSAVGEVPSFDADDPYDVASWVSLGDHGEVWRGRERVVDRLRISAGAVVDGTTMDVQVPPVSETDNSRLGELLWHPDRNQFLMSTYQYPRPWRLQSMDQTLRYGAVYETWGRVTLGRPLSFAAVRDLPQISTQMLPIVADAPGRNGTHWRTTVWLYNPSATSVDVQLRRVTAPDQQRLVTLPAHGTARLDDALAWLGGGPSGDGVRHEAVVITTPYRWGENLVASARIFTDDVESGGTYGQSVPAVPDTLGYTNHVRYRSVQQSSHDGTRWGDHREAHFILDRRDPERYRFNIGFVNDGDEAIDVSLSWGWMDWVYIIIQYRPEGELQYVTVPPHSVRLVDPVALFPPELTERWPSQLSVNSDRPIALWLSMVDNLTGDATFVPYSLYSQSAEREREPRYAVPAVIHGPGQNGTWWRTDLYGQPWDTLTHYNLQTQIHNAFLHPRDLNACGGAGQATGEIHQEYLEGQLMIDLDLWSQTWFEDSGWELPGSDYFSRPVFPDVTQLFEACEGETVAGALEVVAGSWMAAFSRTYTSRDDGGTYGGMLPLYPMGGWPVQHFAGVEVSDQFRVNLGLYNGHGEHAITHRLTLYAADGSVAATTELELAPFESWVRPLRQVLGLGPDALPDGSYGLTVLPLDDESAGVKGRSWAFVSMIDQQTGDPTNWW
jgi:hypothetical protein